MPHPDFSRSPIVLLGSFAPGEEQLWLDALRRAMPTERVLPAEAIGDHREVQLAIVANPDPAVVRRFVSLEWVQSLWAGVEKLVAEPAFSHLPMVRMVDPQLARTMAEAVLAWTLYLHRDMPAYLAQQRAAQWRQLPYTAPSARRIGILGLGELGAAAARTLHHAGFSVQGWSRTRKQHDALDGVTTLSGADGLHAIACRSDILVCLLPLTAQTRHLVGARLLKELPQDACLINFGRGALVAMQDLVTALDQGHLKHAVLDVFEQEPLAAQSPLWAHPKITILPHISADTDPASASLIVARNVQSWRQTGQIPPSVDKARGY